MTARSLVLAGVLLTAAAPAVPEQRLGEVARGIELRLGTSEVVITGHADAGDRRATAAPEDELIAATRQLGEATRGVAAVLALVDNGAAFYDADWRQRIQDSCDEAEGAALRVRAQVPGESAQTAFASALEGADELESAAATIRDAIAGDRPSYGPAVPHLDAASRLAAQALDGLERVHRETVLESPPAAEDPLAAAAAMTERCGRFAAPQTPAYGDCLARQRTAFQALQDRYPPLLAPEAARFNAVRNSCRQEWRDDFVGRNRCELTRAGSSAP